ncbi:MAG TPA: CesT family type III secretion system chaperone [Ramlibacter sp.]|uniref:CesT family type III secretion system chaperone n=1 Tax=Ramlibacter sp. TaxID=1917967 RepID=UPI002CA34E70|nr:CesT family type III secretion system chaperone [Ramlibacter sp.]HVZ45053.1 CesT family type III secretion system chaperone [Ramlibacter sp.]
MSFDSFTRFAEALCTTAGAQTPELAPDANGMLAFHFTFEDVTIDVVHLPGADGDNQDAFVLVGFGAVPEDKELDVLRNLAEANFSLLAADAPVFGMNPASGEIVLRKVIDLSHVDAVEALSEMRRLVGLARMWRADPELAQLQVDDPVFGVHQLA